MEPHKREPSRVKIVFGIILIAMGIFGFISILSGKHPDPLTGGIAYSIFLIGGLLLVVFRFKKLSGEKISVPYAKPDQDSPNKPAQKGESQESSAASSQANEVRKLLNALLSNPSPQLLERFTDAITDAKDPAVTEVLLNLLNHENPGFRGVAIQSLGLVYDPRALGAAFKVFQTTSGDHQQRAALSVINLVANGRDTSPIVIEYLMKIFDDNAIPSSIKAHAVRALRQFKKDHTQVEEFLSKLKDHSDPEIRFAAH